VFNSTAAAAPECGSNIWDERHHVFKFGTWCCDNDCRNLCLREVLLKR
jgi:hypothetical protein